MGCGLGLSLCGMSGLRVFQSSGSGLRVFRGSGLGLKVRSPDDHVISLIPLYLTGGVLDISFPPSSLPLSSLI